MQEKKSRKKPPSSSSLQMRRIEPMTDNQGRVFDSYRTGKHLLLHGMAGTGKTLLSLYLGMRDIEARNYESLYIVRSIVPSRDPGFLPGNLREKTRVYESPYYATMAELYGRGDAYEVLKSMGAVEFLTTSFIRGTTLNDCIIVVDEIQNMTYHEIDSIVTRMGRNCRMIALGDFRQSDLTKEVERRGILDFIRVVGRMASFDMIEFGYDDILRSDTVREYLIAKDQLGISS